MQNACTSKDEKMRRNDALGATSDGLAIAVAFVKCKCCNYCGVRIQMCRGPMNCDNCRTNLDQTREVIFRERLGWNGTRKEEMWGVDVLPCVGYQMVTFSWLWRWLITQDVNDIMKDKRRIYIVWKSKNNGMINRQEIKKVDYIFCRNFN